MIERGKSAGDAESHGYRASSWNPGIVPSNRSIFQKQGSGSVSDNGHRMIDDMAHS
jgi:hypothetical protein